MLPWLNQDRYTQQQEYSREQRGPPLHVFAPRSRDLATPSARFKLKKKKEKKKEEKGLSLVPLHPIYAPHLASPPSCAARLKRFRPMYCHHSRHGCTPPKLEAPGSGGNQV